MLNLEQHNKIAEIKAKMYIQGGVGRARDYNADVNFLIGLVEELSSRSTENEECACGCPTLRNDLKELMYKHRLFDIATA